MRFVLCLSMSITLLASPAATRAAITTQPVAPATTQAATPDLENFPTPAELIEKMKATKAQKDSLPHVAYIAIDEPIVEKPADFSFFGDPDAPTLRSLIDRLN